MRVPAARGRARDDRSVGRQCFRRASDVLTVNLILVPPRCRQILASARLRILMVDEEIPERIVAHVPLSPDPPSCEFCLLAQTRDIVPCDTEKRCGLTGRHVPDSVKKYFVVHLRYLQTARTRSNYYFTRYSGYPVDSGGQFCGYLWLKRFARIYDGFWAGDRKKQLLRRAGEVLRGLWNSCITPFVQGLARF